MVECRDPGLDEHVDVGVRGICDVDFESDGTSILIDDELELQDVFSILCSLPRCELP